MIPISEITEDNDPHSEILSNDSFAEPEGCYPVPYILENFKGFFYLNWELQASLPVGTFVLA